MTNTISDAVRCAFHNLVLELRGVEQQKHAAVGVLEYDGAGNITTLPNALAVAMSTRALPHLPVDSAAAVRREVTGGALLGRSYGFLYPQLPTIFLTLPDVLLSTRTSRPREEGVHHDIGLMINLGKARRADRLGSHRGPVEGATGPASFRKPWLIVDQAIDGGTMRRARSFK